MRDLDQLPGLLRYALREIPADVDRIMGEVADQELPAVRSATPVGDGTTNPAGTLRGATTVVKGVGGRVRFVNSKPYANTIHWGRKSLRGNVSVVGGSFFVYATLAEHQDEINARIGREVTSALQRRVS